MTAPVSQVLSEAADLLEKPGGWMQGVMARDAAGENVGLDFGVCFCLGGAVIKSARGVKTIQRQAMQVIRDVLGVDYITDWNDHPARQHPEVVDALRRAAALAKEQGK
jgi:hypothetical protein